MGPSANIDISLPPGGLPDVWAARVPVLGMWRKSHLEEKVVGESRHAPRRTHVFHGLVPGAHVVADGSRRDDVSVAVIVSLVTGGRLDDHRGDRHVFL